MADEQMNSQKGNAPSSPHETTSSTKSPKPMTIIVGVVLLGIIIILMLARRATPTTTPPPTPQATPQAVPPATPEASVDSATKDLLSDMPEAPPEETDPSLTGESDTSLNSLGTSLGEDQL